MSKGKSLQTPDQKQQPASMGGFGGGGPVVKKPPVVKEALALQHTPAPSTPQDSRTPKSQAPRHQMQPTRSASTPITQRKRPLDAACRPSGEASRGRLQEAQRQQPPGVQSSGIQSTDDGALGLKASDRVGNFAVFNDMADGLELENMGRNKISKIPQPMSDVQWNDEIITLLDRVRDSKGYLDEVCFPSVLSSFCCHSRPRPMRHHDSQHFFFLLFQFFPGSVLTDSVTVFWAGAPRV